MYKKVWCDISVYNTINREEIRKSRRWYTILAFFLVCAWLYKFVVWMLTVYFSEISVLCECEIVLVWSDWRSVWGSRGSPPPPWRSRQAWALSARFLPGRSSKTMASGSNNTMRPYAFIGKRTTSMALFQFGCQRRVYFLCYFLWVSKKACATSSYTSEKEPSLFFYHTWTRELVPVWGSRAEALLSVCQPSLLPVSTRDVSFL